MRLNTTSSAAGPPVDEPMQMTWGLKASRFTRWCEPGTGGRDGTQLLASGMLRISTLGLGCVAGLGSLHPADFLENSAHVLNESLEVIFRRGFARGHGALDEVQPSVL